jgi:hypothetical protein
MSNKSFTVTNIFLLNMLSIVCFGQKEWKTFSPADQSFEILVPGDMKNGEKKLLTDVGEMHPVSWICEGKSEEDPNYLYLVSYVDYPEGTFHPDSIELAKALFKVSLQTHINDLQGELIYESESPYFNFPGVLYRASYNKNKFIVKSRMLLIGERFYALQVYTTSEKSLNPEMNRFLESFRIKSK